MKKIISTCVFCCLFLLLCSCVGWVKLKKSNTITQNKSDTVHFFQICTDTIYLPIYKPTEVGENILYKTISTKHQNFIKYPQGTFEISEEISSDTILRVSFLDRNTQFFAQYGWTSFKGIVYYLDKVFLIWNNVSDGSINTLFKDTEDKQCFLEYSDKLYVKLDEKINWKFVKRDSSFELMTVYPPSNVIDFNIEEFD